MWGRTNLWFNVQLSSTHSHPSSLTEYPPLVITIPVVFETLSERCMGGDGYCGMSPTALELGCGSQGPDRGISGGNKSKILEAGKRAVEELYHVVWELREVWWSIPSEFRAAAFFFRQENVDRRPIIWDFVPTSVLSVHPFPRPSKSNADLLHECFLL